MWKRIWASRETGSTRLTFTRNCWADNRQLERSENRRRSYYDDRRRYRGDDDDYRGRRRYRGDYPSRYRYD